MKKNLLKTLLVSCMTAVMLAGCGVNGDTTNNDNTSEETITVTAPHYRA